jgi:hypothetical protein
MFLDVPRDESLRPGLPLVNFALGDLDLLVVVAFCFCFGGSATRTSLGAEDASNEYDIAGLASVDYGYENELKL